MQADNDKQHEKLAALRANNNELLERYKRLEAQNNDRGSELKQAQEERDKALSSAREEKRNMPREMIEMKAELERREQSVRGLEVRYSESNAALERSKAEIEELHRTINDRERNRDHWKNRCMGQLIGIEDNERRQREECQDR